MKSGSMPAGEQSLFGLAALPCASNPLRTMCSPSPDSVWHGQDDEARVAELHGRFYDAVEALWHKHKLSFAPYNDVRLVMIR